MAEGLAAPNRPLVGCVVEALLLPPKLKPEDGAPKPVVAGFGAPKVEPELLAPNIIRWTEVSAEEMSLSVQLSVQLSVFSLLFLPSF